MYTETSPNNSLYLVIQNRGFKFLITEQRALPRYFRIDEFAIPNSVF
jgi:hypothetical protein